MERGAVNIVSQIGVETTPGTAVAANRFLPTLGFMLSREIESKKFRAKGSKVPSSHVHHKKMSRGQVEGILDYNSFIYLCDGLFNAASPVQIAALDAYTRIWTPGVRSADSTRKTFTVERGDAVACEDYAFGQILGLEIEASQDDFTVSGPMIARYPADNQTLASSPTAIAERPVERNDINVYMDDEAADLGNTIISQALDESFSLGDKYKEFFVHNRTTPEFADIVEIPYEPTFSFSTVHNAQSRTLMNSILDNPYKFIRWEAEGAKLGTNMGDDVMEIIQIDMAVKIDGVEELGDEDQPYGYKYNCSMMPDTTLGGYMKITSICALATL